MTDDESESEWRFSVDEFDDPPHQGTANGPDSSVESAGNGGPVDGEGGPADGEGGPEDGDDDASVAGEFTPKAPIVPEMPDLENAAFVVLGAVLTMLALASMIVGPAFGVVDALTIAVVVGAIGALVYGVLVRLTPEA